MNLFFDKIKTFLPALIFSLCILEMSFGVNFHFKTVYWFYFYVVISLFDFLFSLNSKNKNFFVNKNTVYTYFLCVIIYTFQFFATSGYKYVICTSDMFNILWWSIFGFILIFQINNCVINLHFFWDYTYKLVFFGCVMSAIIGLIKYYNILNNNISLSYYFNKKLIIGSSLNSDYNIYSFGLMLGVLYSFELRKYYISNISKFVLYFGNFLILFSIFLSGSRRGIILFFAIIFLGFYYNKVKKLNFQFELIRFLKFPIIFFIIFFIFYDNIIYFIIDTGLIDKSINRIFTVLDQLSGENERTIRFKWALNDYNNFTLFEQLFGQGFNYLPKMGLKFRVSEDYPHNFLLSTLLYGGLFGFLFSILNIFYSLQSIFKYNKIIYFTILFLFFFGLTSSNSLFSFKIFPILIFLSSYSTNSNNSLIIQNNSKLYNIKK
jgi:hypothetical protein